MIRLLDILFEEEERSVWRTYSGKWAGRNTMGQERYFTTRDGAVSFARGKIKGPHVGRPKLRKRPQHKEKIQKYDVTPVVKQDMEDII